jgi:hypothetical protein
MGVDCPVSSNLLSEVLDMAQSRGHRPGGALAAGAVAAGGGISNSSISKRDSEGGVTLDELLETGHGHIVRKSPFILSTAALYCTALGAFR